MDGMYEDATATTLYERDFTAWAFAQAVALRGGDLSQVDLANVIEEIESLGRAQRNAVRSMIALILEHLLKLDHGVDRQSERQWQLTVTTQRLNLDRLLRDNPSLRREAAALLHEEYAAARKAALASFDAYEPDRIAAYRAALPVECPYGEDVLAVD